MNELVVFDLDIEDFWIICYLDFNVCLVYVDFFLDEDCIVFFVSFLLYGVGDIWIIDFCGNV